MNVPDLQIIENVRRELARMISGNFKHYEDVKEFAQAAVDVWESLREEYIGKMYKKNSKETPLHH